ncbi:MAG: thiamine biosynthesis protein ApbE [Candidatus Solibacter sp.]|nr:thiamine biosynthesis protein ApbE [Candidatus Solibacter sp.]
MRLVAIAELSTGGPPRPPGPECACHVIGGETMGTTWSVRFYAADPTAASEARAAVERSMDRVVAQMSHYLPESDLCRFNAARAGRWVELPQPLFAVLQAALRVSSQSDGAFDVTAGRLVDIWGFGPRGAIAQPPDAAEVRSAMACAGWARILIDEVRRRAWQPGGVVLNLSSIAKGFAVDDAARALDALKITSYLVEAGGELRARGIKADCQPWRVAVESPPDAVGFPEIAIALCGQSVATSGVYHRAFSHEGKQYAHAIDPRTGTALSGGIVSVTVVHRECMLADAYSTAIQVLGEQAGLAFADRLGLAAFVVSVDQGRYTHACSRAFLTMLDE